MIFGVQAPGPSGSLPVKPQHPPRPVFQDLVFLSWLSLAVGGGLFGTLLCGFNNKYRYQVNKLRLSFANLPAPFKGMKIVHISDIHSGSFTDKEAVEKGIRKIMDQKARSYPLYW